VRVAGVKVIDSVNLLLNARQLMFLYFARSVIVYRRASDKPRLLASVHYFTIYVKTWGGILYKVAFVEHTVKVRTRLLIDGGTVRINAVVKVYFRP
jgi:hypothetical protein